MSIEEDNKRLVTEFMEMFSTGDVEGILSFLSPTATWWVAGTMAGISGTKSKAEFAEMVTGIAGTTKTGAIRLTDDLPSLPQFIGTAACTILSVAGDDPILVVVDTEPHRTAIEREFRALLGA